MIKANLVTLYILTILLSGAAFAEDTISYEVGNVKSFLNVRSGPGTIYSILRAIPNYEKDITIVESKRLRKSTWVKIKHNNQYGWVNKAYLVVTNPESKEEELKAPTWLNMNGVYVMTNISPKRGEGMDTHMMFQLESTQAKDLYTAIKSVEKLDKCTGAKAKRIGNMICLHYERQDTYECHFSIDIHKQKIEEGLPCDK